MMESIRSHTKEPIRSEIFSAPNRPEWLRLPKPGTLCPWTGLSRSKLNELILPNPYNNFKPVVQSICLRNRGQKKGVRLIVFDSLMEYLRSFAEDAPDSKPQQGAGPSLN
jgi:hypothetical protein